MIEKLPDIITQMFIMALSHLHISNPLSGFGQTV
jgi:hypothetical protein